MINQQHSSYQHCLRGGQVVAHLGGNVVRVSQVNSCEFPLPTVFYYKVSAIILKSVMWNFMVVQCGP